MVKPGYKQTEIGILPDDWNIATLEELYSITSSKRVFQSEWRESGVPFYRAREIAVMGEGLPAPNDLYISEEMYERYSKQYGTIKENDVLITGVGTLGKVYVVKENDKFYFKDGNIIWLQGKGRYSSQFLKHLYRTTTLTDQVFGNAGGSTVPTYTITNAKVTLVPCPSYLEQCEIAEILSETDILIAIIQKQISKKKAIKQGAMQELLTGKKRLPGFLGEWISCCVDDVAELSTAMVSTNQIDLRHYVGTDNMIADKGGVKDNELMISYAKVREYQCGDVLLSNIRPYLKKIWYATWNGGCSNDVFVIRSRNEKIIAPHFLYYLLSTDSFFDEIMANAVGTKMPRGDKNVVKSYELYYPSEIAEQLELVKILSDMDSEIEALEQKLSKYRQVKQGMMQQLLTGKIRLV